MLKQSGWTGFPSDHEKCVMELAVPRSEIESRYGLEFAPRADGPSTYFIDDLLGPVTIHYEKSSPYGVGYVFVDWNVKYKVAVPRLLEVFGLDPSLVNQPVDLDGADAQHELSPLQPYLNKKTPDGQRGR